MFLFYSQNNPKLYFSTISVHKTIKIRTKNNCLFWLIIISSSLQVTAIFKKLIQLSEFERSEALKYIQQHLDHQTTTSNPAKMPKPVTKTKSQKLRLHRPNKTLAKRKHPLKIGVKLPLLKCRSCTVTAKTKSKLLAHMNESHTGTPISCRKCRCSFNSTVSYEWHLVHVCEKWRNAAERKYVCPECSRVRTAYNIRKAVL